MTIRVFISYSHDSDAHRDRVLALADRLRVDGIESLLDQYVVHPPEGWPSWAQQQIADANFTILVCTPTYNRRFDGKESPGVGNATTWEAWIVKQKLYETGSRNSKMIPVVFEEGMVEDVPLVLRPFTSYRLPAAYDDLYRHLTGQPRSPAPPVGPPRPLPPSARSHVLASTDAGVLEELPLEGQRSRWPRVAAAAAAVGLVALGAAAWWPWPPATSPEAEAEAEAEAPLATQDLGITVEPAVHPSPEGTASPPPGPGSRSTEPTPSTTSASTNPSEPKPPKRDEPKPPGSATSSATIERPPPEPDPAPKADPRRWKVVDILEGSARFVGKRFELDGPAAPVGAVLTLAERCDPPSTSTAGPRCLVREDPDDPSGRYCFTRESISVGSTLCIHPQGTKAESR